MTSSPPPRTSSPPPGDDDMDIDSPIADDNMHIDSPIADDLSGRASIASIASSHRSSMMGSPRTARSGIRSSRPSQQYQQIDRIPTQLDARSARRERRERISSSEAGISGDLVTTIWGTNVNLDDVHRRFRDFILNFSIVDNEGEERLLYPDLIETAIDTESNNLNLNCCNLHSYDAELYKQLISFPQEVLPSFDEVVNAVATQNNVNMEREGGDIWVRPFNLLTKDIKSMRNMNPINIDELISIRGMVIRSTTIIPDIQSAFFRCSLCNFEIDIPIDMGRIAEPSKCHNISCQSINSFSLIHNRCVFKDKQLIKLQEAPEAIPDGDTPQTIDIFVYDQLVDFVKPGDRVEVTGVYRATPVTIKSRLIESVYKTYIDCVHIKKSSSTQFQVEDSATHKTVDDVEDVDFFNTKFDEKDESDIFRQDRMNKIRQLATNSNIYSILTASLAPSIYQMDDIKKGILCQLFGATKKEFGAVNADGRKKRFRDQINILLCGDPGTAKSQLLSYVYKVAPRGIYTSGKGSSAVGLTAYITKDPDSGDLVLESGALVLSDRGICCIDEFDKMSEAARSILHEVMEQQTVSIAKAGIICTLNARTSVLAAANPIESRYNPNKSVVENIDLPPTLMSRFDLIYLVLDRPQENLDRKLAKFLVSLYYDEEDQQEERDEQIEAGTIILTQKELMEYISYSRRHIQPKISDEAAEKLISGYVEMRSLGRIKSGGGGPASKTITATPRQLESLIRISESLARMRHSPNVLIEHVNEAIRLHKVATMAAATDPRTGAIDLDSIAVGTSAQQRVEIQRQGNQILAILREYSRSNIRAQNLLIRYNNLKVATDKENEKINMQDLKKIIQRLEQNEKVRAGDWLQDDPMIAILDRSDI